MASRVDRPSRRLGRLAGGDAWTIAGLIVGGVVLPAALSAGMHSFDIPRNDDWAYLRVLSEFVRAGHFRLVGWGAMTLVGQVLWASPFAVLLGVQPWVLATAVAVLAGLGLIAAYLLARSLVDRPAATVCALLVLAFPGFVIGTGDFMTDVPAFSAEMATLALGAAALRSSGRSRWAWLATSMAVGVFGFSIREFALAAPLAVLVALTVGDRRHLRHYFLAGSGIVLACAAIYLWTTTLPGAQHKSIGLPTVSAWRALAAAYFTLAFVVSPLLPRATARSWVRLQWAALAPAALALAVGGLLIASHQPLLIGNNLTQQGASAGEVLWGARPRLFPSTAWLALEAVALGSGAALAFVATSSALGRLRRRAPGRGTGVQRLTGWFTALSAAGLTGYGLFVRAAMWDRYIWPVAFGTVLLLVRHVQKGLPQSRPRFARWCWRSTSSALALMLAAVTAAVTLNANAYDAARWSAGQAAEKAGFTASVIDAGFEWVGSHAIATAKPGRTVAGAPFYETWYDQMFPSFRDCAFVSGSALDEPTLVLLQTVTYNEIAFTGAEHLYVYAVHSGSCGDKPSP